jgi:hypothetical protein
MGVPSRMGQTFHRLPVRLLLSRVPTDRLVTGISQVGDTSGRLITTALRTALGKDPIDQHNHGQKVPCSTLA